LKPEKILEKALTNPKDIRFSDFVKLIESFGFKFLRTNGSHHLYYRTDIREFMNIQEKHSKAKAYQVRQLLDLVERYDLRQGDEE
jgi:predicted RNA binding protein YcfA (HicA-like mRNA interferase family)